LEATVQLCQDLGHELVEAYPKIEGKAFARAFLTVLCGETRDDIDAAEARLGRKATSRDFDPETWALALLGGRMSAATFVKAARRLQTTSRQIGRFFDDWDVFLTPTLAMPPVATGSLLAQGIEASALRSLCALNAGSLIEAAGVIDVSVDKVYAFTPYTTLFNATGQPAMSVPLYSNDAGLPIGMHFVGRYGDEASLFRLAGQLERARPWFDHAPPVRG
jgi:amidase